jgi:DNA-binding CsgD family transcriptional regulator
MVNKSDSNDFYTQYKKNISYKLTGDVAEICAPLFAKYPLNYFYYGRSYHGNRILSLSSDQTWADYYYKRGNPAVITRQSGIFLWEKSFSKKDVKYAAANFNLYNGIAITKCYDNFVEYMVYASSTPEFHPIEFYCNQKDVFNQFYFYFKERAAGLIKKADKERLILSPKSILLISTTKNWQQNRNSSETSAPEFQPKKISMHFKNGDVYFSPREFEVLSLLTEGYGMKQAAAELDIGLRTVETHLQRAKSKTQSYTTIQLLDDFRNNLFL